MNRRIPALMRRRGARGLPTPVGSGVDYLYKHPSGNVVTSSPEVVPAAGVDSRFRQAGFSVRLWPSFSWSDAAAGTQMQVLSYHVSKNYLSKMASWYVWRIETENVISAVSVSLQYNANDELKFVVNWTAKTVEFFVNGVADPVNPIPLHPSATDWSVIGATNDLHVGESSISTLPWQGSIEQAVAL